MMDDDDCLAPTVSTLAAPDAASLAPPADAGEPTGRASHVLLFNARREVLLRRLDAPGLPQGGAWTSGAFADVQPNESYEAAAARALREGLGLRLGTLRDVGRTWIDEPGARTFLGVFVAAHDGPLDASSGAHLRFVPIHAVLRALRRDPQAFTEGLARALRVVHGEDDF